MNGYLYETHCHTCEVSTCASAPAVETAGFYASKGYAGIWITDHFVCGKGSEDWERRITHLYEGYSAAREAGEKLGLDVFFGWEYALHGCAGTDFLTYGLGPEWLLKHPEIDSMCIRQYLEFALSEGALVYHAHPFREAGYIEMIRLLPRSVTGVEVINANRRDRENELAKLYAAEYGLTEIAGSDNHIAGRQTRFCGVRLASRAKDAADWCAHMCAGEYTLFDSREEETQ